MFEIGTTMISGPLSVTIRNCNYVSLEGEAFSWLLSMSISNVSALTLSPGAFTLDPTATNVGEHGPGMSVSITLSSYYYCKFWQRLL